MDGLGAQVDSLCAVEGVVEDDRNERCGILHRLEGRGNTGIRQADERRFMNDEIRETQLGQIILSV